MKPRSMAEVIQFLEMDKEEASQVKEILWTAGACVVTRYKLNNVGMKYWDPEQGEGGEVATEQELVSWVS